jgi:hypothetical protein
MIELFFKVFFILKYIKIIFFLKKNYLEDQRIKTKKKLTFNNFFFF